MQVRSKEKTLILAEERKREAERVQDYRLVALLRDLMYFVKQPWGPGKKDKK